MYVSFRLAYLNKFCTWGIATLKLKHVSCLQSTPTIKSKSQQLAFISFSRPCSATLSPGVNSEEKNEEIQILTVFTLDQKTTHEWTTEKFRASERSLYPVKKGRVEKSWQRLSVPTYVSSSSYVQSSDIETWHWHWHHSHTRNVHKLPLIF